MMRRFAWQDEARARRSAASGALVIQAELVRGVLRQKCFELFLAAAPRDLFFWLERLDGNLKVSQVAVQNCGDVSSNGTF